MEYPRAETAAFSALVRFRGHSGGGNIALVNSAAKLRGFATPGGFRQANCSTAGTGRRRSAPGSVQPARGASPSEDVNQRRPAGRSGASVAQLARTVAPPAPGSARARHRAAVVFADTQRRKRQAARLESGSEPVHGNLPVVRAAQQYIGPPVAMAQVWYPTRGDGCKRHPADDGCGARRLPYPRPFGRTRCIPAVSGASRGKAAGVTRSNRDGCERQPPDTATGTELLSSSEPLPSWP